MLFCRTLAYLPVCVPSNPRCTDLIPSEFAFHVSTASFSYKFNVALGMSQANREMYIILVPILSKYFVVHMVVSALLGGYYTSSVDYDSLYQGMERRFNTSRTTQFVSLPELLWASSPKKSKWHPVTTRMLAVWSLGGPVSLANLDSFNEKSICWTLCSKSLSLFESFRDLASDLLNISIIRTDVCK